MSAYKNNQWVKFRNEVIELDNETCVRCGRKKSERTILQVHHKFYIAGRKPWKYSLTDCETLCKGCHAETHGKIMPKTGWEYITQEDLGDLIGKCDYCHTELRYLFTIFHEKWGILEVGTHCCDTLTESQSASEFTSSQQKRDNREKRFLNSPRWRTEGNTLKTILSGFCIKIERLGDNYVLTINEIRGKTKYHTLLDAKHRAFNFIESGEAAEYFKRK